SGDEVRLRFFGVDVHPGFATGKLVNAARLAAQFIAALPSDRLTPETTSGREGFVHVNLVEATAAKAELVLIARDFDDELLSEHVDLVRRTAQEVIQREPRARLEVEVKRQYPNMRRYVERSPQVVALAEQALRADGLEPLR